MEKLSVSNRPELNLYKGYPLRILVIEDEPSWQAILSHCIRRSRPEEMNIRFVRTSKQALDLIYNERRFDLIISDHLIDGEMTGFELWLKCKAQFLNIPFIIVTAKNKADFNGFRLESDFQLPLIIQKPFDTKHFKAIMDLYLKR